MKMFFNLLTNEYVIIRNADNEVVDKLKWDGGMYQTIRNKPFKSNMFGYIKTIRRHSIIRYGFD